MGAQDTSTMTQFPTQSLYPDRALSSACPILIMLNTRLDSGKYNLCKSLSWIDQGYELPIFQSESLLSTNWSLTGNAQISVCYGTAEKLGSSYPKTIVKKHSHMKTDSDFEGSWPTYTTFCIAVSSVSLIWKSRYLIKILMKPIPAIHFLQLKVKYCLSNNVVDPLMLATKQCGLTNGWL